MLLPGLGCGDALTTQSGPCISLRITWRSFLSTAAPRFKKSKRQLAWQRQEDSNLRIKASKALALRRLAMPPYSRSLPAVTACVVTLCGLVPYVYACPCECRRSSQGCPYLRRAFRSMLHIRGGVSNPRTPEGPSSRLPSISRPIAVRESQSRRCHSADFHSVALRLHRPLRLFYGKQQNPAPIAAFTSAAPPPTHKAHCSALGLGYRLLPDGSEASIFACGSDNHCHCEAQRAVVP